MIEWLLILPVLIPLIGAVFVLSAKYDINYVPDNVYNTAGWSLIFNVGVILYLFSQCDIQDASEQLTERISKFLYLDVPIYLGADIFSLLLMLSMNIAFLIAVLCAERKTERAKAMLFSALLFVGLTNGYFIAADIISFYIFFAASAVPLMVLVSTYGSRRKKVLLIRFSLYNLTGAFLLLVSLLVMYNQYNENILLNDVGKLNLKGVKGSFVWTGVFLAFISRLPIWPFHYWISAISSSVKNSLVFIVGNFIPLIGIYGFIRFWPDAVPVEISVYAPYGEVICVFTMLFISLVSLSHKDMRYKLFAYTTVCYLLYLTAIFFPTDILKQNIGYALFSYIIIVTVLSFLIGHIEYQKKELGIYGDKGILCYMPRASKCISLFVLAAIGLPVSSLFWNNFIIISEIFNYNLLLGITIILSLIIVSVSLLEELYRLKDNNNGTVSSCFIGTDLPDKQLVIYMVCLVILFLSFFKPLWFVL